MKTKKHPKQLPVWATLFTALSILILCSLGTWQVKRLMWKTNLIEKLDTAYKGQNPATLDLTANTTIDEFTFGKISGHLIANKAFLLGPPKMHENTLGLDLIVPIKTSPNNVVVLVNMGWTNLPIDQQPIHEGEDITFTGLIRHPNLSSFLPKNNPNKNLWYTLNTAEISTAKDIENLYEGIYFQAISANKNLQGQFFTNQTPPKIRNNHLQYAAFWFTMAACLLIIYFLRFINDHKPARP